MLPPAHAAVTQERVADDTEASPPSAAGSLRPVR